ncbi:MAG TPA: ABC transporter permease [Vicinamibacterales bacterium]|nr:ABC transporter permease [Vicinamibacterales bacterium]
MRWLEELRGDVRFAMRQMRSAPGFAAVAVMTLALGIGVNSAIFALVDATLLRPLPLPDSDRLVMIWERSETTTRGRVSPLNMIDLSERARTFEVISGYVPTVGGMVMAGTSGVAENVARQWLPSPRIFDALGVRPIIGRTFQQADEAERANVVVLSDAFWRVRFGADPAIIGRDLRLDGAPFTVVGVVPDEAQLLGETDLWALRPFGRDPGLRAPRVLLAVGRMKPGITLEEATADLTNVADALAQEYPEVNQGRSVMLEPLRDALVGADLRRTSLLFVGVVGFVLLICCANVANLLLARATVRDRELAIRAALGAGRPRVIRQLLTESLLLSLVGAGLGLALGAAILSIAPRVIPAGLLPGAVALTFDARVVLFAMAAALLVGIVFGLAPAWQATKFASPQVNTADSRTTTGGGTMVRDLLVVGEVATAVLLLFGAGLLLRTLLAVENVDRGYRADNALTMIVDPMASSYPTPELLKGFFDEVEREIVGIAGVDGVAWASTLPLGPSYAGSFAFEIVGDAPRTESERATADLQIVSGSYFRTLELPIVEGREFTEHDTRQTVPVCIVNEAFVRTQLQGRSPIGVRVSLRPAGAPQARPMVREIAGVARQVKGRPDETEDFLQVYVPMTQLIMDDIFLVVRSASAPADTLAPSVRAAIGRVDKAQLVSVRDVRTLDDIASAATSRHRFRAVLVMTFAGLALLLAMVGVFGTLGYTVQQRVREFGLRIALGASGASILSLVAGSALRVIAAGAVLGLVLAALASRLLTSMLFGVEPLDTWTFVMVTIVLALMATVSTAGPAWRATRVDPAVTLRGE